MNVRLDGEDMSDGKVVQDAVLQRVKYRDQYQMELGKENRVA